ncbi:hypothetical protein [Hymenobacter sp. BT190]|uniref:hypothetical protein n=1 Tax=Hymenobacter sp. BT190 TaxID=2763505 RepID=UPI001650DF13|nr:hypothetical protein [Hymenobacter sp. BT190]MBC6698303.1 hypothetical protein [Hymenobacter sp. BT190]
MRRLANFALLVLTACDSHPIRYQRTALQLPTGIDSYIPNKYVDTLAQPLLTGTDPVPTSVLTAVKNVMLTKIKTPADSLQQTREATYYINDSVTAFLVQAMVNQPRQYLDCIGLYKRNGNFDFYTHLLHLGSEAPPDISLSTEISQLNGTRREYQITYISRLMYPGKGRIKSHDRISFKDTLNQFLWYKLESGSHMPY